MLDFINDDTVNINMTSLKGKTFTTYDKLVEVFGNPTFTDASPYEKVNAQWTLEFKIPFTDDTGIEDFETVTANSKLSVRVSKKLSILPPRKKSGHVFANLKGELSWSFF